MKIYKRDFLNQERKLEVGQQVGQQVGQMQAIGPANGLGQVFRVPNTTPAMKTPVKRKKKLSVNSSAERKKAYRFPFSQTANFLKYFQ